MDIEQMRTLQAYGYVFFIIFLAIVLYSYYYHLHKSEKTGRRNYEKYGNLALNDSLEDGVLENENANKEIKK